MEEAIYNVALFASGNGTNVQRICDYFRGHSSIHPTVLVCNNPKAYVLERAKHLSLPVVIASPAQLKDPEFMLPVLRQYNITHIVLAGFLCLVPSYLVDAYPNRIVNIHPALLPKFGGKGMYGMHVHEAVAKAGESHSGITVHLVDSHYDHGTPLFQARFPIAAGEDAEAIAGKIHILEQTYFPLVIEKWISGSTPNEFPALNQVDTLWNRAWKRAVQSGTEQDRPQGKMKKKNAKANTNTQTL